MHQFKQLSTAVKLLSSYKGSEPFHLYLKKYYLENRKHGSTDRKNISSLCYAYFRLGKLFINKSVEDRILLGLFLSNSNNKLLLILRPEWESYIDASAEKKLANVGESEKFENIFPYSKHLSEEIHCNEFAHSLMIQPDLFIRIREGKQNIVEQKLLNANISFNKVAGNCLRLPMNTKLESVLDIGKEVVIQDLNSQKLIHLFYPLEREREEPYIVWDCCAASGGKSIMAYDVNPKISLTVSDIRSSILENLNSRFTLAGIKNYNSFTADLTDNELYIRSLRKGNEKIKFDFIIADVPCTGSGTWARTPDNLFYFNEQQIEKYAELQRRIIKNSLDHLADNGYYLYITCSVFKEENEQQVAYIKSLKKLKLEKMELFKGYNEKADTMFAALFSVA